MCKTLKTKCLKKCRLNAPIPLALVFGNTKHNCILTLYIEHWDFFLSLPSNSDWQQVFVQRPIFDTKRPGTLVRPLRFSLPHLRIRFWADRPVAAAEVVVVESWLWFSILRPDSCGSPPESSARSRERCTSACSPSDARKKSLRKCCSIIQVRLEIKKL